MNLVAVIPARGGSKGIPKKNITLCGGQPLISYTARASKESQKISRTIVSTDDSEIADVCKKMGIDVPFMRPSDLAEDESPMLGVLIHALEWLETKGEKVDALVLLQPTSPLRTAKHIDESVELFQQTKAASVVSVVRVPHQFTPGSLLKMKEGKVRPYIESDNQKLRRQDKPVLFARNGPSILIVKPSVLKEGKLYGDPTVGYEMGSFESIDVDGSDDIHWVEKCLKN